MGQRILLVQGHPDGGEARFNHALADAYARGASGAGHDVERIDIAALDFPLLSSKPDWDHGTVPAALAPAQQAIGRAAHVVVTMGMPALVYRWYFRAYIVKALERNILAALGRSAA